MGGLPFAFPPTCEQTAIIGFLDRETAKIDALVSAQRQLIGLLQEKRQAVISQAVTKGLDPAIPMKDSGIEWLGEVPAHWTVSPLKRFLGVLSGYAFSSSGFSAESSDIRLLRGVNVGVGRVRWEDVVYWPREEWEKIKNWELRRGDVVLGMDRPWISDGLRIAQVSDEDLPCLLLQRVAALRPTEHLLSDYLPHLLQGQAFFHHCVPEMTGVSVPHISPDQIGHFVIALPSVEEQTTIIAHVRKLAHSAERLIGVAEAAIEAFEERRAALITAAVTGKIDVRATSASELLKFDRSRLRVVVGAHIVEALAKKPGAGRTKTHKIVYLTQIHASVHELEGAYVRQAAGPLDTQLVDEMESAFKRTGCISVEQPDGRGRQVLYTIREKGSGFQSEFHAALGSRAGAVNRLIADLADFDVHAVEAITTLYAVWNDFVLDGQAPSDDEIVRDFLENWHPKKAENFRRSELHTWLSWMRRHGFVPQGRGPRTITGRLFA
jgi:type I restriction enzyme S subunit